MNAHLSPDQSRIRSFTVILNAKEVETLRMLSERLAPGCLDTESEQLVLESQIELCFRRGLRDAEFDAVTDDVVKRAAQLRNPDLTKTVATNENQNTHRAR